MKPFSVCRSPSVLFFRAFSQSFVWIPSCLLVLSCFMPVSLPPLLGQSQEGGEGLSEFAEEEIADGFSEEEETLIPSLGGIASIPPEQGEKLQSFANGEIGIKELIEVFPRQNLNGRELLGVRSEIVYALFLIKDRSIALAEFDLEVAKSNIASGFGQFVPKLNLKSSYQNTASFSSIRPESKDDFLSYGLQKNILLSAEASRTTSSGNKYGVTLEQKYVNPETLRLNENYNVSSKTLGERYHSSSLSLTAKFPLMKGKGKVNLNAFENSKLGLKTTAIRKILVSQGVLNTVAGVFWDLALGLENLRLRIETLENAKILMDEAKLKADLGDISRLEAKQAENLFLLEQQSLESAQLNLINFEQEVKDAVDLKDSPLGLFPVFDEQLPPLVFSAEERARFVERATANSLEHRLLQQNLAVLQLTRQRLKNEDLASLDVDLTLKLQGHGQDLIEAQRGYAQQELYNYSAGISFSMPLDGVESRSKLQSNQTEIAKKQQEMSDLIGRVTLDVEQRLRNLRLLNVNFENARLTEGIRKELFEQEQSKFRVGLSTLLNVDQARLNLFTAATERIRIFTTLRKQFEELVFLTGDHPLLKVRELFGEIDSNLSEIPSP